MVQTSKCKRIVQQASVGVALMVLNGRHMRWLTSVVIGLLGANACTSAIPQDTPAHRVYEMRNDNVRVAFSLSNADEYVAWLDGRRVLFRGYDKADKERDSDSRRLPGLFVWDVESGSIKRYGADAIAGAFCYADGSVGYLAQREGRRIRLEGVLGEEQELQLDPKNRRELNPFTCKLFERSELPGPKYGGAVYPLRVEDGWIERVKGGLWIRPISGHDVKVTIPTLVTGSIHPHKYSTFARKYLYYHAHRDIFQTWAFSSKGSLELLTFPPGPWGKGRIEPIHNGLVLRSRSIDVRQDWAAGYAGLYIHTSPNKPRRLAEGIVYAMAVAGDGCRIAFLLDPWNGADRTHRLMAVDVCKVGINDVGK